MSLPYASHGGLQLPANKQTTRDTPIRQLPLPPLLQITLAQYADSATQPCVQAGQSVRKGQLLAQPAGPQASAVHAPTSGTVLAIAMQPSAHPAALAALTLTLQPDGRDSSMPPCSLPGWREADSQQLRTFLQQMGIVAQESGLFPPERSAGSATLLVNGAESAPYRSCDERLMQERAADIAAGIEIAAHALQAGSVLIGIDDDKPQAIAAMQRACQDKPWQIVALPARYPNGDSRQLIHALTGLEIPYSADTAAHGMYSLNVDTLYAIARAVLHGEPLLSRIVTVAGAVSQPGNLEVLIGTPLDWLLQQTGQKTDNPEVIMGDPMTGFTLPTLAVGLDKHGSCLIAKSSDTFPPRPAAMPCIRCGECASVCPTGLQPMALYRLTQADKLEQAQQWQLFDCIECNACSYVCPSQIPLVDDFRRAKSIIHSGAQASQAAQRARSRFTFRQFRIERDKAEKADRLAARAAEQAAKRENAPAVASSTAPEDPKKQAIIAAAMARAAAQQQASPLGDSHSQALDDSKQAAIKAAMERAAARKAAAQQADSPAAANPAPAIGMDEAKQAAVKAAMERAAARKATAQQADSPAAANPAPATGMDEAKQAAVKAAMERAAARKATAQQADSPAAANPAPATGMDEAKQAAVKAAMERAAARKATAQQADSPAAANPAPATGMDEAKQAAVKAAMERAAARKAAAQQPAPQDQQGPTT
ncbi:electron transport complex subunit RsxC [Vogesella sp. LIG4]|uniref:electron transport complex subunit RsxC n=1 Tax=Vogesella sp. LIG4 TaxID=1192162 RepID=UPI00081FCD83|nr:electron transport complex subunit RsxC [Vogesella sp. LIG4]SCK30458.1 electron transport complex protein RnfC [Vogesella sp. LIG4]